MLFVELIDRSLHEDRLHLASINFLGEKLENLQMKFRASVRLAGEHEKIGICYVFKC